MLVLVPTNSLGNQDPPREVPFGKNVKIMSPEEFASFIGLHGERRGEFLGAVNLAKDSTWKEGDYRERLAEESKRSRQIIDNRFTENTKDFRRYIREDFEMPKDILYDKKDKSRLDYYTQDAKVPITEENEKLHSASEGKDVTLPDHLQEKAVQTRDPVREERVPDSNQPRNEPPEMKKEQEEKTRSRNQDTERTRIVETRERL